MIAVLSKPKDEIDLSDIEYLIDSKVPEGERIEFKRTLQAKGDGSPDPWMSGQGLIGDRAKNEILKEVVAFGNAQGGALLLGIVESKNKPPIAAEISPIPRCAELAERLKLVFRDCVEPAASRARYFRRSDGGRKRRRHHPYRAFKACAPPRYENARLPYSARR